MRLKSPYDSLSLFCQVPRVCKCHNKIQQVRAQISYIRTLHLSYYTVVKIWYFTTSNIYARVK